MATERLKSANKKDKKTKEEWFFQGNELYDKKQYFDAIDCYNKAIELDLHYKNALVQKAYCLFYIGQHGEAIKYCNKALEIDPNDQSIWCGKGSILAAADRKDKALECYEKALKIDPNYVAALKYKGQLLYEKGEYYDARNCYERIIEIGGDDQEVREITLQIISYINVLKVCDTLLIHYPDNLEVLTRKAEILAINKHYKDALELYKKCIKLETKNNDNSKLADLWRNKGDVYQKMHNDEIALECYDKALKLDTDCWRAWEHKGDVLIKNKQPWKKGGKQYWENWGESFGVSPYEEIIECYDNAYVYDEHPGKKEALKLQQKYYNLFYVNKNVKKEDFHYRNGLSLYGQAGVTEQEKHKEAIMQFDLALSINSKNKWAWNAKGRTLQKIGKFNKAIDCYNKVIEIDATYIEAWHSKIECLVESILIFEKEMKYNEAIDACRELITKHEKWSEEFAWSKEFAWYKAGYIFQFQCDYQKSLNCYENTIQLKSSNYINACRGKGRILCHTGKFDEAITSFQVALEEEPKNKNIMVNIALVKLLQEKQEEANTDITGLLEIDKGYYPAIQMQALYLYSQGEFEKAKEYFHLVLNYYKEQNYSELQEFLDLYYDSAYYFIHIGEYNIAKIFITQGLTIMENSIPFQALQKQITDQLLKVNVKLEGELKNKDNELNELKKITESSQEKISHLESLINSQKTIPLKYINIEQLEQELEMERKHHHVLENQIIELTNVLQEKNAEIVQLDEKNSKQQSLIIAQNKVIKESQVKKETSDKSIKSSTKQITNKILQFGKNPQIIFKADNKKDMLSNNNDNTLNKINQNSSIAQLKQ